MQTGAEKGRRGAHEEGCQKDDPRLNPVRRDCDGQRQKDQCAKPVGDDENTPHVGLVEHHARHEAEQQEGERLRRRGEAEVLRPAGERHHQPGNREVCDVVAEQRHTLAEDDGLHVGASPATSRRARPVPAVPALHVSEATSGTVRWSVTRIEAARFG